jgi:hypothetical protein
MASKRCSFKGWRSRLPLLVVVLGSGVVFGLVTSNGARAQDPEPTTVPTPTVPAPDPAPEPAPRPKPRPRAVAPRPAPQPRAQPEPAPQFEATATVPTSSPRPTVAKRTRAKAKPKKVAPKPKVQRTSPTLVPPNERIAVSKTLGASVSFVNPAKAKAGDAFDVFPLLVVLGLVLAITCFAIALIPATAVPWRPAAIFVSDRQFDLTVVGVALLLATVFTFVWGKGF